MMRCGAKLIAVALAIAMLSMANLYSQLLNNSRNANPQVNCSFRWSVNPNLIQKVSTPIVAGRLISFPVLSGPDPKIATSALHGRRLVQQGNVFPQASAGTRGMLLQQETSASLLPSAGGVGPGSVQSVTPIGGAFFVQYEPTGAEKGIELCHQPQLDHDAKRTKQGSDFVAGAELWKECLSAYAVDSNRPTRRKSAVSG